MRIRWYILPTLLIIGWMCWSFTIVCNAIADPDFEEKGSITIVMMNEETNSPVPGGEVCLYPVAKLQEQELSYCYTEEFALCDLLLSNFEEENMPSDLAEYAKKQKIQGIQKSIDENGTAVYENLSLGLYLLVQTQEAEGYYKINPFLVTVPMQEDDGWNYEVYSLPKMEKLSKKDYLFPVPSSGSNVWMDTLLPKTGQLWWPVPILAFCGSVCILIGFMLGKRDAKITE